MNESRGLLGIGVSLVLCAFTTVTFVQNCYASNASPPTVDSIENCFNSAKTQLDLDECAGRLSAGSQRSVEDLYNRLLSIYAGNASFSTRLEQSQTAWAEFTQMQLLMKYPHSNVDQYYGSVYPMCVGLYLDSFSSERITSLTPSAVLLKVELMSNGDRYKLPATLKTIRQTIVKKYSADKEFISAFQVANMTWTQYKDAQIAAMYPHGSNKLFDGTKLKVSDYLSFLLMQRINDLKPWTSGIEEGDVCAGSVKTPDELSGTN